MRLLAIEAELHVFREEVNWEQPLRLGISISGRPFIRMWHQRGDLAGFDAHPLEAEDFGEVGCVQIRDVTDRLDPGLRGAEIAEVRILHRETEEPVGVALLMPGRETFCAWIQDDELRWGSEAMLEQGLGLQKPATLGATL